MTLLRRCVQRSLDCAQAYWKASLLAGRAHQCVQQLKLLHESISFCTDMMEQQELTGHRQVLACLGRIWLFHVTCRHTLDAGQLFCTDSVTLCMNQ